MAVNRSVWFFNIDVVPYVVFVVGWVIRTPCECGGVGLVGLKSRSVHRYQRVHLHYHVSEANRTCGTHVVKRTSRCSILFWFIDILTPLGTTHVVRRVRFAHWLVYVSFILYPYRTSSRTKTAATSRHTLLCKE